MTSDELFEGVVQRIGLTVTLGPGLVKRALSAVGVTPKEATASDYAKALSIINDKLEIYLDKNEANKRLASIHDFLSQL